MAGKSPTQRSLAWLREQDFDLIQVVEHWNPHARIRQDLFGFIDILAIKGDQVLAVQSTSASNTASRAKKIMEHENYPAVLAAGWNVIVHGWGKRKNGRIYLREVAPGNPVTPTEEDDEQ